VIDGDGVRLGGKISKTPVILLFRNITYSVLFIRQGCCSSSAVRKWDKCTDDIFDVYLGRLLFFTASIKYSIH